MDKINFITSRLKEMGISEQLLLRTISPTIDIIIPSILRSESFLRLTLNTLRRNRVLETTRILVWCNEYTKERFEQLQKDYPEDFFYFHFSETGNGQCEPYNHLIYKESNANLIVTSSDDMIFFPGYDEAILINYALMKYFKMTDKMVLSFKQVYSVNNNLQSHFMYKDFGRTPGTFKEEDFYNFCQEQINNSILEEIYVRPISRITYPMIIPRQLYIAIGGLDENYVLGARSDDDIFLKLQYLNIPTYQVSNMYCYHFGGVSTNNNNKEEIRTEWDKINNDMTLYLYKKWGRFF